MRACTAVVVALTLLLSALGTASAATSDGTGNAGLVVVVDASGSMAADAGGGLTRIEAARQAGVELVRALPDQAQVGLLAYGQNTSSDDSAQEEGCQDVEVLQPVEPLDRATLTDAIEGIQESGYTPIGLALQRAADELGSVEGQRTIVLISDGIDTCAPPDPCGVAEQLAADGVTLTVETVGFQVDDDAREQLECIADVTGGSYRDAPDAASLSDSIRALSLRAFRTYQPVGQPIDGGDDESSATTMPTGQFVDQIVPGRAKHYSLDLPPDSDAAISVVAVDATGRRERDGVRLSLVLSDAEGDCESFTTSGSLGGLAAVSAGLVEGASGRCDGGGPLTARVGLAGYEPDEGDPSAPFSLELRYAELLPGQSLRPPSSVSATTPDQSPLPGSSVSTAPLVTSGTFVADIRSGERQFWAVVAERGQSLAIDARAEPLSSDGDGQLTVQVKNGALQGGRIRDERAAASDRFDLAEGASVRIEPQPVGEDTRHQVYGVPALFYVQVTLSGAPVTTLVDYQLDLAVTGEPVPDPTPEPSPTPESASETPSEEESPSVEPSSEDPTAVESSSAVPAPDDDGARGGGVPWLVVLLAIGAAVAVGIAIGQLRRDDGDGDGGGGEREAAAARR